MAKASHKNIGRLSLYRRLLQDLSLGGKQTVFSHQLAAQAGVTAAQVRRDLMAIGYTGSPTHGYVVEELIDSINNFLDAPDGDKVALIGVGNLGRAILAYLGGRHPRLSIVAAFDIDPNKTNRVLLGTRCYPMDQLEPVLNEHNIHTAIITAPAETAQQVTDLLVHAGIRGILNFAPVPLKIPKDVFVEPIDMAMSLEKVAWFARRQQ